MPLSPAPRLLGILPDHGDRVDLDIDNQCLWVGNQAIALTPKAFQMFHYLALHEKQIVSPRDLRLSLWSDTFVEPSNVKKYILEIRKALGDNPKEPRFIETLHRRGYRFLPTVRAVAPRPPLRNSPSRPRSPLVGRQAQLDDLEQRFTKAEHGERQIVFVAGQSGIGKSALVQEFRQWLSANQKACCGLARCHDGQGATELHEPLLDALENLCESDPTGDIARSLAENAPSWLPHLSAYLFKESRPGQQITHQLKSRRTMSGEMIRALCAISQTTTIVLIIEEFQWADPATIALINDFARRTVSAKLMIVATLQTPLLAAEEYPLNRMIDDLSCHSLAIVIPLEPLVRHDIEAWLSQLAPHGRPNRRLADVLWEFSGGHPFIMHTTLDDMTEQGFCQQDGGEWCISDDFNVARIPDKVRRFVELQLDRLPKNELALLEAASVVGVQFSVAEVEAALEIDSDSVDMRMTRFIEANYFVRHRGSNPVPAGQRLDKCEFFLASFCEIVYDRIPSRRKRKMHHRLAAWLEAQFRRPDPDVSCSIAYHFQKARDWAKAAHYILLSPEPIRQGVVFEELRQLLRLEQGLAIPFSVPQQQKRFSEKERTRAGR